MIEGWSVVPERVAVDAAGSNVEVVHGDGVTFAYGADALVVIVDAGDRPHGNVVAKELYQYGLRKSPVPPSPSWIYTR
ncbi:hypothetical protein [Micromonospora profundi]|uniref:hypothetical protein n=1 Tax=Micromonospora profundi TaxID=1420889 RepID=UPI00364B0A5E